MKPIKHYVKEGINYINGSLKKIKEKNKQDLLELETINEKLKTLDLPQESWENRDWKKMALFWITGAWVVYFSYIIFQSLQIIYLIATGYIISIAMEIVIEFFMKRGTTRWIAISFAYILLMLFILSWLLFVIPFVLTQLADIIRLVVANINSFQELLSTKGLEYIIANHTIIPGPLKDMIVNSVNSQSFIDQIQYTLQQNISQFVSIGSDYAKNIGGIAVNFVTGFLSVVFNVFLVLTLAVLFSIDKEVVVNFLSRAWGKNKEYVKTRIQKLYKKLWIRLKSQLFLCLYIGLIVWIMLWILSLFGLDLPNKWSLAIISWLTEFIPYLWPALGAIPALLIASLTFGWVGFLIILVLYWFIQWTENNVLIPYVMNKTLGVYPVVSFMSMIIGGIVFGFVWVLLAVPIAVILTMIFDEHS